MGAEPHFHISRPFPFPAFPGLDFRDRNSFNALHENDNVRFQDFLETRRGNGVETAEILVSTFPYILRIYGGAFPPPTIYEATNAVQPIPEIPHRITPRHADARALTHFAINQPQGGQS